MDFYLVLEGVERLHPWSAVREAEYEVKKRLPFEVFAFASQDWVGGDKGSYLAVKTDIGTEVSSWSLAWVHQL